jgi:peptide/nickel transport system substrate-binding protein
MKNSPPLYARLAGWAVACAVGAAATAVCAQNAPAPAKTLRMAINNDLKVVDPLFSNTYVTRDYGYMAFDTLFSRDSKGEPKPQMLERFTQSPDNKAWTFTLRPSLKFSDGSAVTSADVVATLQRWAKRATMGLLLADSGAEWKVVDDKTFSLQLKEGMGQVPLILAAKTLFIVPEKQAKAFPDAPIPEPIGSGPFIFKRDEWIPGNRMVFVRNPNYVPRSEPADGLAGGKRVKLDRVEWRYMPDANTSTSALKNGEVDIVNVVPPDYQAALRTDANVRLAQTGIWQPFMVANTLAPPFNNPKARAALMHLVNQEEILAGMGFTPEPGKSFYCPAVFMCGAPNETAAGAEAFRKQDFEKAKALLKEAGYKGEKIVFLQPTDGTQSMAALIWIQYLKKAGLNLDVQVMDQSSVLARVYKKEGPAQGGWSLYLTASKNADVDTPLTNGWVLSSCKGSVVPGWPCDAKIDELRDAWIREGDAAKRKQLVDNLQRRFYEAPPYIPYGQYPATFAARKDVKGTELFGMGIPIMWNVDK